MRRKDAEKEEARRLRAQGTSIKRIAARVGVSVSSVSVWVRDVETPPAPAPIPPHVTAGDEPTRRCSRCDTERPLTAFNRNGRGHQHWCRECFRAYFRERGARHREQSEAARLRRREIARRFIREHLAQHPCVDCGEDDILVLEFDHHRGDKEHDIARLLMCGARLERIEREIERCEIVCVNCHRRRTATRAGSFRVTSKVPASWTAPQHRNGVFLLDVLRASGCCDCGERDPVVLDFDHLGEKRAGVTRLALRSSVAALRAEIERCVIRCANCHRVRTLTGTASWRAEDHWAVGLHGDP